MQQDGGGHALVVVVHDGAEHRRKIQTAHSLHFRQVLVVQGQAVDTGGGEGHGGFFCLVLRDHALTAAGVAGEGVAGHGVVGGEDTCLHQGRGGGDESGGVAAGVGQAFGGADGVLLGGGQLGKAIRPGRIGAVRRGGVDDPHVGVVDQGDRLHRSGVRQAQEHQVSGVEQLLPLRRVFALVRVDGQQGDVLPIAQPLVDLQAGGTRLAVNVNGRFHDISSLSQKRLSDGPPQSL